MAEKGRKKVTCGVALMRLLKAHGVDTVFGMPGVHTLELYRSLNEIGIKHVGVRHEQGAGFMADGYARVSGKPGVCVLISGPGVTNAATPIGQAYSDSVPMIVLSSVAARRDLRMGRGRLHEISRQDDVTAPITAFSATVLEPNDVPELVARAYATFAAARPRPVHIALPLDVITAEADFPPTPRVVPGVPLPDPRGMDAAVELLAAARRPAIIVGGGAARHGKHVLAIAEKIGAAVVPTIAGKGVIPDDHPLAVNATMDREATQKFLAKTDLLLVVGSELAEPDLWTEPVPHGGKLIRIDIDPTVVTRDSSPDVAILGDAGTALKGIAKRLAPRNDAGPGFNKGGEVKALRQAEMAALTPLEKKHVKVLGALRQVLPEDGFVFTDMTQIAYSGYGLFGCVRPNTWFFPAGYGTLGFAVPAAIGAAIAAPERPAVALVGDGGFQFTMQELGTAVEQKLPLAIVLWNNDALAQIRDGFVNRGIEPISVVQHNPDFLMIAKAYGCRAVRAESLEHFQAQLRAAWKADGPTVVEVREDSAFLT